MLSQEKLDKYIRKAETLTEALPFIKEFNGKIVVIKYGGAALVNPEIKETIIKDIALMRFVGMHPVVVHGGGPEINSFLKRLEIESKFVDGLRVTDEKTMEVVEMVLAGKVNKQIVTDIELNGVKAVGMSGKDGGTVIARKIQTGNGVDYGCVGEIDSVDPSMLKSFIKSDIIPVIAPIGKDEKGNTYNINADYMAVAIAGALNASKLLYLTDVAGVLKDVNDPDSLLSFVKADEVQALIEDGTISGGMIPKVECCLEAVKAGVNNVHILDGRIKHCLILELFTKNGIGTMIEKE